VHRVPVQEVGHSALLEDLVEIVVAVRAAEEGLTRDLDLPDRIWRWGWLLRPPRSPGDADGD
jgi:hypothetical protein